MATVIAVDAMGSDSAPRPEIEGALQAARHHDVHVLLVGRREQLAAELAQHRTGSLPVEIVHASEAITMDDKAGHAIRKRDTSMRVGLRLIHEGRASGFVTAGNTGAAWVTAKTVLGMIPGVSRPALAAVFPTTAGTPTLVLDVGANVDVEPANLKQFAIMGDIYMRSIFGSQTPRVGLLSIGEEEVKGNSLTKAAHPLLKKLPLNFVGNVEGRDIFNGRVDVVVCDGFIGNVVLKTAEGLAHATRGLLKESIQATITRKVGFLLARKAFEEFKKRVDYTEYGGAPLLGVNGVCIIGHGSSNARAIKNAIRVAAEFSRSGANAKIANGLQVANGAVLAAAMECQK